jgi:hypothetical protein
VPKIGIKIQGVKVSAQWRGLDIVVIVLYFCFWGGGRAGTAVFTKEGPFAGGGVPLMYSHWPFAGI